MLATEAGGYGVPSPMKRVPLPNLSSLTSFVGTFEFRSVSRWLGLSAAVGLGAGLAASAFYVAVSWVRHVALGAHGICLPQPAGEVSLFDCVPRSGNAWLLVVAPAIGGLLSVLLCQRFAAGAQLQGTNGFISTFHQGSVARKRTPFVQAVAAVVVLGTGGSAGREGPVAYLCSGVGRVIGRWFRLSVREHRLMLIAGAAGGIGAIFQTPLGAALFALEVLYRDDFEVDGLVPAVLSSVLGYSVFTTIIGEGTMFTVDADEPFDPRQLPLYLAMGVVAAVVGGLFIKVFERGTALFGRVPVPGPIKALIGGALVGVLGLWFPPAVGTGYGWVQRILESPSALGPGWIGAGALLGVALLKVFTTTLTLGSGAAGGSFGPSIVIGGMLGGACGLGFHTWFPEVVPDPSAFVIVGMAAFVGGVARAPISTLVMASEMTKGYHLLVPLMLCEGVTFALMVPWTMYRSQVRTRRESAAHSSEYVLDVLRELDVRRALTARTAVQTVRANLPIGALLGQISGSTQSVFPVVAPDGGFQGLLTLETLKAHAMEDDLAQLAIAADCSVPFESVSPDDSLGEALERFVSSHCQQLPVVDPERPMEVLGLLSYEDLLRAYNEEVLRSKLAESSIASERL